MANLLLTWRCNRRCSYCFAQSAGRSCAHTDDMAATAFDEALAFFRRSKLTVVGLLGGEPGLHPRFAAMVRSLLAGGLHVRVFTGGLLSERNARFLAACDVERVRVVVNVPEGGRLQSVANQRRFERTLSLLSGVGSLGYTIVDPHEDLSFLADLTRDHALRSPLRLGLAIPRIDDPAEALLSPAAYGDVAVRVLELAEAGARHGVELGFDCGFVHCMFTPAQHARLLALRARTAFTCGPIIDIGPDLSVWSCFPLKALDGRTLGCDLTREALVSAFWRGQRAYRNLGVYERCMTCDKKRTGTCAGGCLAHVIRSFQR